MDGLAVANAIRDVMQEGPVGERGGNVTMALFAIASAIEKQATATDALASVLEDQTIHVRVVDR